MLTLSTNRRQYPSIIAYTSSMFCSLITCSTCSNRPIKQKNPSHNWSSKSKHDRKITRISALSWWPRLRSWTTSERACEQRTWRCFFKMAAREMARLTRALNLEVLKFLPRRASIFFPMSCSTTKLMWCQMRTERWRKQYSRRKSTNKPGLFRPLWDDEREKRR